MMEILASLLTWFLKTFAKCSAISFGLWLYKELTMGICACAETSEQRLKDKVVVITGATSGIGRQGTIL